MHASAEDYLETILILSNRNNYVRSIDIVSEMGFSRPSVSIAMRKLRDKRLINVDEHGNITLTESGRETASCVYDKHLTLYNWLRNIGVSDKIAANDACLMEHILNDETFMAIKKWLRDNM